MDDFDDNELLQCIVRRHQFAKFMVAHRIPAESYSVDIAALPRFVRLRIGLGSCQAAGEHACVQRLAREIGATPVRIPWLPPSLAVYSLPSSGRLAGTSTDYRAGAVCGMDCASVVAVIALAVAPGLDVLDLCCAPGTKLALIADLMCGRGTLTGVDVSSARLSTARSQLMRMRLFGGDSDGDNESAKSSSSLSLSSSSSSSSAPSPSSAAAAPVAATKEAPVVAAAHTPGMGHTGRSSPRARAGARVQTETAHVTNHAASTSELGEASIATGAGTLAQSPQPPQKRARVSAARHTHAKPEQGHRETASDPSGSAWTCRLYHGDSRAFRQGPVDYVGAPQAAGTPRALPANGMKAMKGSGAAARAAPPASIDAITGARETNRAAHPVLVAHSAVQMQNAQKRLNKSARARLRRLIAHGQAAQNVAHGASAKHLYDRVLVDAECTHDGSLRHLLKLARRVVDPNDAAHTWDTFDDVVLGEQRAATVQVAQQELLRTGFTLLRPGGFIVYATCSLSRRQNEDVIASLLKAEPAAQPVPILAPDGCLEGGLSTPPCELVEVGTHSARPVHALRFTPRQGTSGLFVAKITKVTDRPESLGQ